MRKRFCVTEFPNLILLISLFVALISSFYIMVRAVVYDDRKYKKMLSVWDFPMILAMFLENIIMNII